MKTLRELEDEFADIKLEDFDKMKPEDYDHFIIDLNEILADDPSNIDALKFKYQILFCQYKFEESIEVCDLVLRKWPDDIATLEEKMENLSQLSKYKECIEVCQQILRIAPKHQRAMDEWDMAYTCADDPTLPKPPISTTARIIGWAVVILIVFLAVYYYFQLNIQN